MPRIAHWGHMTDSVTAEGIDENKAFKKQMIDKHRSAFAAWLRLAQMLEEVVVKDRTPDSAFSRALDLFFIQAFKSHQSLYLLAVVGHGEDAATVARRLFEISLQVGYLCSDPADREERGRRFLAHFWHNSKDLIGVETLPEERRKWWEEQYERHKHLLLFNKRGEPSPYWFGSNFAQLAETLGIRETYDKDYRFLSHVAHSSSRGLLLDRVGDLIQIKTDLLVREILVFGTRYALWVAANWNAHFALIDSNSLDNLRDDLLSFDFKHNEGGDIILSPRPLDWSSYFAEASAASEHFMEGIEDLPVQERKL